MKANASCLLKLDRTPLCSDTVAPRPAALADAADVSFAGPVDGISMLGVAIPEHTQEPWPTDLLCKTHGHHGEQVIGRTLVMRQLSTQRIIIMT